MQPFSLFINKANIYTCLLRLLIYQLILYDVHKNLNKGIRFNFSVCLYKDSTDKWNRY